MNNFKPPWREPVVVMFHELLQQLPFLTYESIANRLNAAHGTVLTKNACIGFGRRAGVPKRQPPRSYAGRRGRVLKPRPRSVPKLKLAPRPPKLKPKLIGKVPLMELGPRDCRWPFGTGPFLFCGDTQIENCSYCLKHALISYPVMGREYEKANHL